MQKLFTTHVTKECVVRVRKSGVERRYADS